MVESTTEGELWQWLLNDEALKYELLAQECNKEAEKAEAKARTINGPGSDYSFWREEQYAKQQRRLAAEFVAKAVSLRAGVLA